jgi:hypothetical protein
VPTRRQPLTDEDAIAARMDSGRLPPMADPLAKDDRGELP